MDRDDPTFLARLAAATPKAQADRLFWPFAPTARGSGGDVASWWEAVAGDNDAPRPIIVA